MFIRCLAVTLTVLLTTSCPDGPVPDPGPGYGNLSLFISDTDGKPLNGVKVGMEDRDSIAVTDRKGECLIEHICEGYRRFRLSAENYEGLSLDVQIQRDSTIYHHLSLSPVLPPEPYLEISVTQVETLKTKGRYGISVKSNSDWHVENHAEELSFENLSGTGDSDISFSWDFPEESLVGDTVERHFDICNDYTAVSIPLRLHVPIKILSVDGHAPNLALDAEAKSTATICFNRAVRNVEAFIPAVSTMPVDYGENNTTVTVHLPGNYLLGNFGFSVRAVAKSNSEVTFQQESVNVRFFDRMDVVEGNIIRYWLSADETYIWAATSLPDRIYKLETKNWKVEKQFNLSFTPVDVAYNYYNNRLYVVDREHERLRVLSPDDGRIIKSIRVSRDSHDHPSYPIINPNRILFADNGYGILTLFGGDNNQAYRFRVIDSRKNDEIQHHPDFEELDDWTRALQGHHFAELHLDNTRSLILAQSEFGNLDVHSFNATDNSHDHFVIASKYDSPYIWAGGTTQIFRTSREKRLILFGAPYSNVLYNIDTKTYGPVIGELEGRSSFGDFCYGQTFGGHDCTYLLCSLSDSPWFTIEDHTTGTIPYYTKIVTAPLSPNWSGLLSFRSGDRIVVFRRGDINDQAVTCIYTLYTDRFDSIQPSTRSRPSCP